MAIQDEAVGKPPAITQVHILETLWTQTLKGLQDFLPGDGGVGGIQSRLDGGGIGGRDETEQFMAVPGKGVVILATSRSGFNFLANSIFFLIISSLSPGLPIMKASLHSIPAFFVHLAALVA